MISKSVRVAFLFAVPMACGVSFPARAHVLPTMVRPAEYICYADGEPLDLGSHAIPCVCDWNNDGRKDLVVGYRYADKVALYLNYGTDSQPLFTCFVHIYADGEDICHPSSGCGAPAPWVCDYDGDGRKDLLVGTGSEGYVYFYQNINTDADPVLIAGVALSVGDSPLSVGIRATPYVHDWDEDGLNDLLCGDGNGNVHFFKNVGTAQSPSYADDSLIQAGGMLAQFGYRSAIRVCDWDGDGLKDLLGSGSNNVSWCKNVGTNACPLLKAPVRLQSPIPETGLADIDTGYRMRLEVVDWNDDGMVDLLIGDDEGYIFYYEGYHFGSTRIEIQSNGEIAVEWNSAEYLEYTVFVGRELNAMSPVVTHLPSGGKTTRWTECFSCCGDATRYYRVEIGD